MNDFGHFVYMYNESKRSSFNGSSFSTILVTVVRTAAIFSVSSSKIFNTGREGAQLFVGIWMLHGVSKNKGDKDRCVNFEVLPSNNLSSDRSWWITSVKTFTVEPQYNEVLDITNDFLYPNTSKIYEKEPRYNETSL